MAHALFSSVAPSVSDATWNAWVARVDEPGTLFSRMPWLANTAPAFFPMVCMVISACALVPLTLSGRLTTLSTAPSEGRTAK